MNIHICHLKMQGILYNNIPDDEFIPGQSGLTISLAPVNCLLQEGTEVIEILWSIYVLQE